jgi:adenylate kinase
LRITDPIGKIFIDYSSRGQLVPDEPTIDLWRRNIEACTINQTFNPDFDTLVLDGIPRNVRQAEILKDTLDVRAVLHLTCPDMNKMVERLQRRALRENRLDDANLEIIRERLETYEKDTQPVLKFYGDKVVHNIDSTQTPINVLRNITDIIARLALERR